MIGYTEERERELSRSLRRKFDLRTRISDYFNLMLFVRFHSKTHLYVMNHKSHDS